MKHITTRGALILVAATVVLSGCDPFAFFGGGEPTTVTEELSGTISENATLESGNLYAVTGNLTVEESLTIEPGTYLEFAADTRLLISGNGSINAIGTSDDPIVMRGAQDVSGFWKGIEIHSSNTTNRLEHVTIANTGSSELSGELAAILVDGLYDGKIALSNVTITDGDGYGVYVESGGTLEAFSANSFSALGEAPAHIHATQVHILDGTSTYANSTNNYVEVGGGTVEDDVTWAALPEGVAYRADGNLTFDGGLVVQAGTTIEFESAVRLLISGSGSITADGSTGGTITFAGAQAVKGYWLGIEIHSSNATNILDEVQISDAGHTTGLSGNQTSLLIDGLYDGYLTLQNSTIVHGGGHGMVVENGGTFINGGGNAFEDTGDDNGGSYQDILDENS